MSPVRILRNPKEMQEQAEAIRRSGRRIGVVPTMGALHEGHLSLVRMARERADLVIVTLFVNPTQFGPGEDFERYPRDFQRDIELSRTAGAEIVFAPEASAMYPEGYRTFVVVEELTAVLEGAARPGHFRGVTTIVTKLLNLTKPHVAVFGQKDAQQVAVLRRMVGDLNLNVEIIVAPIVREDDGLAMSSRNVYLTPPQRSEAPLLFQSLRTAAEEVHHGERRAAALIGGIRSLIEARSSAVIEYVSVADPATLGEREQLNDSDEVLISLAVKFGSTRLIDNILVRPGVHRNGE
jgi:pantoate--beta-alanine ligase